MSDFSTASLESLSPDETLDLGRRLGRLLSAGEGVALEGELGAGKTLLVRGLAEGLGVDAPEEVRSPTYLLMIEHPGPIPLRHLDAYFAQRSSDFLADGGEAYLLEEGVLAVEWGERLRQELPPGFLRIRIEHTGLETRRITLSGLASIWRDRIVKVERAMQA